MPMPKYHEIYKPYLAALIDKEVQNQMDKVITMDELERFSADLIDAVKLILS